MKSTGIDSNRSSLLVRLWDAMRRLQQLNRQPGGVLSPSLGLRETFVLFFIDAHPLCSIAQMRNYHRFHQSVGSVLIAELTKKGLIKHSPSPIDARERRLQVTTKGSTYLTRFDDLQNKHVSQYLSVLSSTDQAYIEQCFSHFADAHEIPPYIKRRKEHSLRSQMRRVFIALGFLESNFADSGLTLAQFQLIAELKAHPHLSSAAALARRIGTDQRAVVFQVKALKDKKLISAKEDTVDKRRKELAITDKGSAIIDSIRATVDARIQRGVESLSTRELEKFVLTIERVTETGALGIGKSKHIL